MGELKIHVVNDYSLDHIKGHLEEGQYQTAAAEALVRLLEIEEEWHKRDTERDRSIREWKERVEWISKGFKSPTGGQASAEFKPPQSVTFYITLHVDTTSFIQQGMFEWGRVEGAIRNSLAHLGNVRRIESANGDVVGEDAY